MKRILFNLKFQRYDLIRKGEKTVEYREVKPYWHARIVKGVRNFTGVLIPNDWFAVFRNGYGRPSKYNSATPDIVCRILKIDIGPCPYDGWDGEYFRIHFEQGGVK